MVVHKRTNAQAQWRAAERRSPPGRARRRPRGEQSGTVRPARYSFGAGEVRYTGQHPVANDRDVDPLVAVEIPAVAV